MHVQLGARDERRCDEERRGGGEVPGHLDLAEREALGRCDRDARRPDGDACARRREHALGVVARRAPARRPSSRRRRRAPRAGPRTSPGRSRPAARSRSRGATRPRSSSGRWPSVVSTRAPIRPSGSAIRRHRPPRERLVARELEALSVLPGEDPGDAAGRACRRSRSRSAARGARARARPFPRTRSVSAPCSYDVDPERAHRGDRRLGVRGAAEARDARLAVADRPEQDRRGARSTCPPGRRGGRRAAGRARRSDRGRAHSSITGAATTP